jgi:hypothetical protein
MIGMMELVVALAASFFSSGLTGLPISVPPLPPDPVIERAAPDTCLFYFETAGVASPEADSKNLTEQMLAGEEMQEFLVALGSSATRAARMAEPRKPELVDAGLVVVQGLLARPLAVTIDEVRPPSPQGPPAIVASFVLRTGTTGEVFASAVDAVVAGSRVGAAASARPEPIPVAGNPCHQVMTPIGPLSWGHLSAGPLAGTYVVTIGEGATESLVSRLSDATRKPPAWKNDLARAMPVERMSTLTYLNAGMALEILSSLPAPDRDRARAVLDATGVSGLKTIGSRTGMTAEGVVSSLWLGFDGEPKGFFAKPTTGIGPAVLTRVPADSVIAQSWSLDLSKSLALILDVIAAGDPQAAATARDGLSQFRAIAGFDVDAHLLKAIGPDWTVLVSPSPGAIMPSIAIIAGIRDAKTFASVHKALLAMLQGATANQDVQLSVREVPYRSKTLFCLDVVMKEGACPIEPTWCLTGDSLVVTLSPQLMKTLLSRDPADGGLGTTVEVAKALIGSEPSFVATAEPRSSIGTLSSFYEIAVPIARGLLAQKGIDLDLPQLPASSAILPFIRPSVTVIRHETEGILLQTVGTVPLVGGGSLAAMPSSAPILVALLLPAISAARDAANRSDTMNSFKQVLIALQTYEVDNASLPSQAICDKQGQPLLSWRVAILPYIGEQDLYDAFRLEEPWDSEHNRVLLGRMPWVFSNPLATAEEKRSGLTTVQVLAGPDTPFANPSKGMRPADVTDGMGNTLAVVEAVPEAAVPWTKPADIAFDPDEPLSGVGNPRRNGGVFVVGFLDGVVRTFTPDIDPEVFKALVTPAGDEPVPVP